MRSDSKLILAMVALLALSACKVQSKIQGRYVRESDACQSEAESNIDRYTQGRNLSTSDRNAELVTLFSDCMGKKGGWQVAKPKRSRKNLASTAPLGSPTYLPGLSKTAASPAVREEAKATESSKPGLVPAPTQEPVMAAQPGAAVNTQSTPLSPSPSMAPLNPPVTSPVGAPPASYQPGIPQEYVPTYGTGPGRSF